VLDNRQAGGKHFQTAWILVIRRIWNRDRSFFGTGDGDIAKS
jgi:hypothetical protein